MKDKFNRKINYLRISITDRCNLRCKYCMPAKGIESISHSEILRYEELHRLIGIFKKIGITKIRITGGEPLIRKDAIEFLSQIDFNNIFLTTNLIVDKKKLEQLIKLNLQGINVSLDSLNKDTYKFLTGFDKLNIVINNLKLLNQRKIENIKINTVLMQDINDNEIFKIINFGKKYNFTIRFIEKMNWVNNDFKYISNKELIESLIEKNVIEEKGFIEDDSVAEYFKSKNHNGGKIGFISPHTKPFCNRCNRIRMSSDGKLKLCLFSKNSYDIKKMLRDNISDNEIIDTIKKIIFNKDEYCYTNKGNNMYKLGG